MTNNVNKPRSDDAVLGGKTPTPLTAAVLGGLQGVKQRLANPSERVRIAALYEAIEHGRQGVEELVKILTTETGQLQGTAYDLLWDKGSQKTREKLLKYSPVRLVSTVNYSKLRKLLAASKWKEADEEMGRIMLQISDREDRGYLNFKAIQDFPSLELHKLDKLWLHYSGGRFGLSVQKQIWRRIADTSEGDYSTWLSFCDRLGWRVEGHWLTYRTLTSQPLVAEKIPDGHLPAWLFFCSIYLSDRWDVGARFDRVLPILNRPDL